MLDAMCNTVFSIRSAMAGAPWGQMLFAAAWVAGVVLVLVEVPRHDRQDLPTWLVVVTFAVLSVAAVVGSGIAPTPH